MVEYIIIIGIAVAALYVMGPAFKRAVESVVKGTSDQIGVQVNSDQDFQNPKAAVMDFSTTAVNAQVLKNVQQWSTATGYASQTDEKHYNATLTNTLTQMGFSE